MAKIIGSTTTTPMRVVVDSELDINSTNPVQNKAVAVAIGDIDTALDSIIAIQENLINGPLIEFTIATFDDQQGSIVYYAKEGMTWAEWCDNTQYNTIGAYINVEWVVAGSGRMWMTESTQPEQGTNTIIDQAKYYLSVN